MLWNAWSFLNKFRFHSSILGRAAVPNLTAFPVYPHQAMGYLSGSQSGGVYETLTQWLFYVIPCQSGDKLGESEERGNSFLIRPPPPQLNICIHQKATEEMTLIKGIFALPSQDLKRCIILLQELRFFHPKKGIVPWNCPNPLAHPRKNLATSIRSVAQFVLNP